MRKTKKILYVDTFVARRIHEANIETLAKCMSGDWLLQNDLHDRSPSRGYINTSSKLLASIE